MELATILGLVLGFGAMILSTLIEGGELGGLLNPSAALIVFGGTLGATLVSFPLERVKALPSLIKSAFIKSALEKEMNHEEVVALFGRLAEKARREGLLSLEQEANVIENPFLKRGVLLVVDGIDPTVVENVMDIDIAALAEERENEYSILEAMGGYSPTMGIIGTVLGLVQVLGALEDPSQLGPAIAVAFVATLYGVAAANLLWLPLASKLKTRAKTEIFWRQIMSEGVLAVQAGDNPRIVREKLEAFMVKTSSKDKKPAAETMTLPRGEGVPVPADGG